MNREIKFRGRVKKRGEWVYGYYVFCRKHHYILQEWDDNGYDDRWEASEWDEVFEESVGQCIGLKDKWKKDIYNGDILRIENGTKQVVWVEWDNKYCQYRYKGINYETHEECFNNNISEGIARIWFSVIGTIHENPELLGGKK